MVFLAKCKKYAGKDLTLQEGAIGIYIVVSQYSPRYKYISFKFKSKLKGLTPIEYRRLVLS